MDVLHTIETESWAGPFAPEMQARACDALESGKVLYFPRLAFVVEESEQILLTPDVSDRKSKNVSLKPNGELSGAAGMGETERSLKSMMERFARSTAHFVTTLIPSYAERLERAPTSYRPVEIAGRAASPVHDDTRLHVDAFPSRPMRGRRIMRLFSNIHPGGAPRVWHVGEPFEDMARKFLPQAREGVRLHGKLLAALGITRGARAPYDNLMLCLHDGAKLDSAYQEGAPQAKIAFPSGSTWICYTDQVMHAALAGQFVLEQTFHLDVDAMAAPARSPLRTLERLRGHALV